MAQVHQDLPTTQFKLFLTLWAFMENLLFSGLRAGWPALVYVLKQESVYSHLCTEHGVVGSNVTQTGTAISRKERAPTGITMHQALNLNEHVVNTTVIKAMSLLGTSADRLATSDWTSGGSASNRLPEYDVNLTNQELTGHLKTACDAQDAIFNQCFTVATATMALSGLLYGQLNYKYGIRVPRLVSVFVFVAGSVSISFVDEDFPWLIFPGFLLISSGGMALYLTNNQISYMFTRRSAALVGLLCGALEASSFVQTVIKLAYEHGVSLRVSYLILAGLFCVTLVSTFLFLPKDFITASPKTPSPRDTASPKTPSPRDTDGLRGRDFSYEVKATGQLGIQELVTHQLATPDNPGIVAKDGLLALQRQTFDKSEVNNEMVETSLSQEAQIYDVNEKNTTDGKINSDSQLKKPIDKESESVGLDPFNGRGSDERVGPQTGRQLCQCLRSKTFLLYLLWACVVQIVLAMCLGTFNPWLEFVTNKNNQEVSRYTDVLFYSMLGSPVLSLCIGVGMDIMNNGDKKDKRAEVIQTLRTSVVSLGATSVMAVVQCVLVITCHHDVIVISSVMLVIFRTAMYSCGTAFLRIMYPSEYFGILCGIMSLLAGGFSFLQYPLFLWIQLRDQAWKEVFGLLGLLGIISFVQPLYLFRKSKTISLRKKSF